MKAITACRACQSQNLTTFLELGDQYLSDFRPDRSRPTKAPLTVVFCQDCTLVQLKHSVPQLEMYHENYGFKSGVSDSIKQDLDSVVINAFQYHNDPRSWLDIASNDGTLLSFVPSDVYRVGVDPVGFLCEEAIQHADVIVNDFYSIETMRAQPWFHDKVKFDVITSVSCFYDMPDPGKFVEDVEKVLAPHGAWVIQQNYLLSTLEYLAVDNFCHEHLEYYTLTSLEKLLNRYGLEVNEVRVSDVNGGSIRTVVSHKGSLPIDESVEEWRRVEWTAEVDRIETYQQFAEKLGDKLERLHHLVRELRSQGKTIAILAASTRGGTIWQSAEIDRSLVEYAIERNPAKVGKYFSAIDIPIISEEEARGKRPDYMLVGPWFFSEEIIDREQEYLANGGHLIIPLPELRII